MRIGRGGAGGDGGGGEVEGDVMPGGVIVLHLAVDLVDAGRDADGAAGGNEEDVATEAVGGAGAEDAEGRHAEALRILVVDEGDAVAGPGDEGGDGGGRGEEGGEGGTEGGLEGGKALALNARREEVFS